MRVEREVRLAREKDREKEKEVSVERKKEMKHKNNDTAHKLLNALRKQEIVRRISDLSVVFGLCRNKEKPYSEIITEGSRTPDPSDSKRRAITFCIRNYF